jgi:hypothetical protein
VTQVAIGHRDCRPLSIWTHGSAKIEVLDDYVPNDVFWLKVILIYLLENVSIYSYYIIYLGISTTKSN